MRRLSNANGAVGRVSSLRSLLQGENGSDPLAVEDSLAGDTDRRVSHDIRSLVARLSDDVHRVCADLTKLEAVLSEPDTPPKRPSVLADSRRLSSSSELSGMTQTQDIKGAVSQKKQRDRDRLGVDSAAHLLQLGKEAPASTRKQVTERIKKSATTVNLALSHKFETPGWLEQLDNFMLYTSLKKMEDSQCFNFLCAFAIFGNAVLVAASTEHTIANRGIPSDTYDSMEFGFNIFYMSEFIVRLVALRLQFFVGPNWNWNVFDMALVIVSLLSTLGAVGGSNVSYLRIMRLAKMMKLLRMIRLMRSFRELRLVMDAIMGGMKAMMWTILLVLALTFMFGTCFVNAVAESLLESDTAAEPTLSKHLEDELITYWGSLGTAMQSLFKASTGGVDWQECGDVLITTGSAYYGIFVVYIAFFTFVVMNALTSLFVDSVRAYSEKDIHTVIEDEIRRKDEFTKKLMTWYKKMDMAGSGEVTLEVFKQHVSDPAVLAFASSLGMDITDLNQFFGILSCNGRRPVDCETFVVGCIRLRGGARSIDLMDMLLTMQTMYDDLREWVSYSSAEFRRLRHTQKDFGSFSHQVQPKAPSSCTQSSSLAVHANDSVPRDSTLSEHGF